MKSWKEKSCNNKDVVCSNPIFMQYQRLVSITKNNNQTTQNPA